jgi:hypothetical protein
VSEVLSGKRELTLTMIQKLHEGLGAEKEDSRGASLERWDPLDLQPGMRAATRRKKARPRGA